MTPTTAESDVSTIALDVYWASGRSGDAALESHVAGCDRCRAYLASLDSLAESGPVLPFPAPSKSKATRRQWAVPVIGALALASLRRHGARTGLAIIGVAVAAALLLDMVMLGTGMRESFRRFLLVQGFDLRIAPKGTLPMDTEATIGGASGM